MVTGVLFGFRNMLEAFGMKKGILPALLFSVVTVSPMFISSAFIGKISDNPDFLILFQGTVLAGLLEEFPFRGFLFGILFKRLKWEFIPASVLGAIIFGVSHIYQGTSVAETTGIFFITTIGAVWFAWLYIEWDSLWVPIFMHVLMNLSWILFEVSDNALGGIVINIFRGVTIAASIIITIYYRKKSITVKRGNLLINRT